MKHPLVMVLALTACALVTLGACSSDAPPGPEPGDDSSPSPTPDVEGLGDDWVFEFEALSLPRDHRSVTEFRFVPNRSELLLLELDGTVTHYALEGSALKELGSFTVPGSYQDLDCGLISVAFDPDWESNGYVYFGLCYSEISSGVSRFVWDGQSYDIGEGAVILEANDPRSERPWHNVGAIGFDAQGYLWALFGEKVLADNGQRTENILGGVARVVPNREPDGSGSEPAPDNPWIDEPGFDPRLYAYGLRSPWRGHLDSAGRLWLGDVGADTFEEINVVPAGGGTNHGWRDCEGPCDAPGTTNPVTFWNRSSEHAYVLADEDPEPRKARVAWVGVEWRDRGVDPYEGKLAGRIPFGDMCVGYVRVAALDDANQLIEDRHVGHMHGVSGWDQGPDGYLYMSTYGECVSDTTNQGGGLWRVKLVNPS